MVIIAREEGAVPSTVNTFILGFHDDGELAGGVEFGGWFSDDPTSTEFHAQSFLAFAYQIKRGTAHVGINSSNQQTEFTVRRNGGDVPNTLIIIPSNTTGSFDTGAIDEAVASNDLTNLEMDKTGMSGIVSDYNYMVQCEVP